MAVYGYASINTSRKRNEANSIEAQRKVLEEHGAVEVFEEHFSESKKNRLNLPKAITTVKKGDVLVVTTLGRLARSATEALMMINFIVSDRGAALHVLNIGRFDDEAGRLLIDALTAFTEFEREKSIDRVQQNKEDARMKGVRVSGRPKKYTNEQLDFAMRMHEICSYSEVAKKTGIGRSTLIRENDRRKGLDSLQTLEKQSRNLAVTITQKRAIALRKGDHAGYENDLHCLEDMYTSFPDNIDIASSYARALATPPREYDIEKRKQYIERLEEVSLRFEGKEKIDIELARGLYIFARSQDFLCSDEVIPRLERLVAAHPENAEMRSYLDSTRDPAERPALDVYGFIEQERDAAAKKSKANKG